MYYESMEIYDFGNENAIVRFGNNTDKANYFYHINNFPFKTMHGHKDYWEFTIVTKGSLKNVYKNKEEIINAGTLFYTTTSDYHYITEVDDKNAEMKYLNILVRESTLFPIINSFSKDFLSNLYKNHKPLRVSERFIYDIEKIIHQTNLVEKYDYVSFNNFMCSALILILQKLFSSQISTKGEHKFVDMINDIMTKPDFLKLNVNEFCEKTGYSRMQLDRLMREHYKQTPHEFLTSYRLRYAESLLLSTDMSIQEICETIGYSGMPIFCSNFKKVYGTTPLKYKCKNK